MTFNLIEYTVEDRIATIRFNRPEKKNALSPEMNAEIRDAVRIVRDDPSLRGLVLTGVGDSFSAGLDLDESFLKTFVDREPERYKLVFDPILDWYRDLWNLPIPTIASVNGHCYGGGLVPASLCDIAIASETATFALSEINFAHFPAGGSTWAASHFLLPKHYMYLCLTGDRIDANEAFRIGLVTKVVSAGDLEQETTAVVSRLAAKHPSAYATAKKMCRMTPMMSLPDAINLEMAHIHENLFLSKDEMIRVALRQFEGKKFRPGVGEDYVQEAGE